MLNQHQKFHKAQQVTQQLATLCSEVSMDKFKECLSLLNMLRDEWAKGIKMALSGPPTSQSKLLSIMLFLMHIINSNLCSIPNNAHF